MLGKLDKWGPMTTLVFVVVVVAVVAGAVVTIVNPDRLAFEDYLGLLWKFGAAAAGMGVARALNLAGEKLADAHAFRQDLASDLDEFGEVGESTPRTRHAGLKG